MLIQETNLSQGDLRGLGFWQKKLIAKTMRRECRHVDQGARVAIVHCARGEL